MVLWLLMLVLLMSVLLLLMLWCIFLDNDRREGTFIDRLIH